MLTRVLRVVRTVHANVGKWLDPLVPPQFVPFAPAGSASKSLGRFHLLKLPNYTTVALRDDNIVIDRQGHCWAHELGGAPPTCMAAAGNGVVIGDHDGTLRLISLIDPRTTMHFKFGTIGPPITHVVAAGHNTFVCALLDGTIQTWAFDRAAGERAPLAGHPTIIGLERISEGRVLVRYEGGYEDELQV